VKLTLARDVTVTAVESGAVILDGRRGRYWQLNESGAAVLRMLLEGADPAATAASLFSEALVTDEQARHDVQALVDSLSAAMLVEVTI
jgi:Coenzyme PQQ synthesis protein D (PqqD)